MFEIAFFGDLIYDFMFLFLSAGLALFVLYGALSSFFKIESISDFFGQFDLTNLDSVLPK